MNKPVMTRRTMLAAAATGVAAAVSAQLPQTFAADEPAAGALKGRIRQAICRGCGGKIPFEELCAKVSPMGIKGVDLIAPKDFATLKKYNLVGTMTPSHGLGKGLNKKENHAECLAKIREAIEATAEAGFPNVICFSGNRSEGLTDEEGAKNCIEGLKQVMSLAEQKKVTLCMELLNSKLNHKGYMCDHTAWGAEVCKGVGSERMKLLYDIYHMQIDEGDVINTIRKYKDCIGHYHTAGVPGRNEIDETQELYYPAIMRAIAETGFAGYVAHEYGPKRDPLTSLAQAIKICDV